MGLCLPLLLPLGISFYEGGFGPSFFSFLYTIIISFGGGLLLYFIGKKRGHELYRREAFLLVFLVYLFLGLISALPFCFSKTLDSYVDAFFEMVSGYTTTGATIMEGKKYHPETNMEVPLIRTFRVGEEVTYVYYGTIAPLIDPTTKAVVKTGIEAVPKSLLVWRSLTQFLGGGGIVILFLALLPILGVGGKVLYQAEATGPSKETMAPRLTETASKIWKLYLSLTIAQIILLCITNPKMPFLDALCISFSTLSTGGFSPRNESIGAYHNGFTEAIVILFMLLGSINFSLYFFIFRGKLSQLKDSELLTFLGVVVFSVIFAALKLSLHYGWAGALAKGAFQVISIQTTTGFFTENYNPWPYSLMVWLFILMFVGGMAGSTAGGIKIVRLQIILKLLVDKIESIFRPDAVRTVRLRGKMIEEKVATTTLCFFIIVVLFAALSTFVFVLEGNDPITALSTSGCMLNNVGLGFGMGGPEYSFAFLSPLGKLVSCLCMIAGRLEFFVLMVLILPAFWKTT